MFRGTRGLRLGIAAIAACFVLLAPGVASAQIQTITPTKFTDEPNPEGCTQANCSLRDALALASTQGGVIVNLLPGTYEVTRAIPLTLVGQTTINGAGARATTIDGNGLTRVLLVQGESPEAATINDVSITGGNTNVDFQQFEGGGIYVQHPAGLALNRSAVVGNRAAAQGGGIYTQSGGVVQITDSTISGNVVGARGAGGGVAGAPNSNLRLFNTTISGNEAPDIRSSAGLATTGALEMVHVTMAANVSGTTTLSVGLISGAPVPGLAISNSIITSDTGPACEITPGRSNTGTNNLADDTTCSFGIVANPLLGPLQNNGGPTNTHALGAGSPAIDSAAAALCRPTDQRGTARPQLNACDIGAFEYVPPPPPPPPPPPDDELPPPRAGRSVNVIPKSGTVRIKLPGRKKFRRLTEGEQIPVGTTIDTRKGRVTLIAAANKSGKTATSDFYDGIFKVTQSKGARPITTLKLVEKLSCAKPRGKATIAAKRKKKRRLWGDGKGRFRTDGSYSSATVRGTKWLVEDRCKSTLTRVVRGKVAVRDRIKKKTVILRRGKRYVAKARS